MTRSDRCRSINELNERKDLLPRGPFAFRMPDDVPGRRYAAAADLRTASSTAINSPTTLSPNSPSGPRGVTSVKGEAYSCAAWMEPCSVR